MLEDPASERLTAMARPRGDHVTRRRLVVQATCRLIARHGVEGATVRAVAHELGVATKAVTRYFHSKEELLLLALDHVIAQQVLISSRHRGPSRTVDSLVKSLATALPTTPRVRNGWRIWIAFLGEAVGNPALQRQHRERYTRLRRLLLGWLRDYAKGGAIPRGSASLLVADQLLALVDGIGMRDAVNPRSIPAARQREMLSKGVVRIAGVRRR
jgi:AcrR family transcriptional regulator